jgi:adenylate kinase
MHSDQPIIILFGPPCSGKGTLCDFLKQYNFEIMDVGKTIRKAIDSQEPNLDPRLVECVHLGIIPSDEICLSFTQHRIPATFANGFVFDGFARSPLTAAVLDDELERRGVAKANIFVIALDVPENVLFQRMGLRRDTALAEGRQPRSDDNTDTFRTRLNVYVDYSAKMLAYYGDRVHHIDAGHTPEQTLRAVLKLVGIPEVVHAASPSAQVPAGLHHT